MWHEASAALPPLDTAGAAANDDGIIETKSKVAERLLQAEAAAFAKRLSRSNPADAHWLESVRLHSSFRSLLKCVKRW